MEGLLWLLLWGASFYFMMRFGCGSHMVHGHGQGHGGHDDHTGHGGPSAKDPVCGMDVAPGSGYSRMYQGREYRLCSRECLDQFDTNPSRYSENAR